MTAEHRGQHDTQVRGSAGGEHDGVDDVVAAISARAGTFQAAAAAMRATAAATAASADLFVDEEDVKLTCPISFSRLTVPAKGAACRHTVGPAGYCSPRHTVPCNSRNEGSKCVG